MLIIKNDMAVWMYEHWQVWTLQELGPRMEEGCNSFEGNASAFVCSFFLVWFQCLLSTKVHSAVFEHMLVVSKPAQNIWWLDIVFSTRCLLFLLIITAQAGVIFLSIECNFGGVSHGAKRQWLDVLMAIWILLSIFRSFRIFTISRLAVNWNFVVYLGKLWTDFSNILRPGGWPMAQPLSY